MDVKNIENTIFGGNPTAKNVHLVGALFADSGIYGCLV